MFATKVSGKKTIAIFMQTKRLLSFIRIERINERKEKR